MPAPVEALIAVALAASLTRAFFGPPPGRADPVAAAAWLIAGVLLLAAVLATGEHATWRLALTAAASGAVCAAGWWLRAPRDDGDDGEDSPGRPPVDWDELDRLRGGWDRGGRDRPPVAPR